MFNMDFLYQSLLRGTHFVYSAQQKLTFQQIIMYVWQCPHDVDVHLIFCFDLYLHLTCSQGHA